MKILIGADKGGFVLKNAIAEYLQEAGYEFEDWGTLSIEQPKFFSDIAHKVAEAVSKGEADKAILVCGTGMGMSIVANKHKGVRAAVVESQYAAMYARKINDANVLCLGGFIIGCNMGLEIAETFLNTEFVEDFPQWRVDFLRGQKEVLKGIEEKNFK